MKKKQKKYTPIPTPKMLTRLIKFLGLRKEEVIEEAIKEMYTGIFNE